MLPPGLVDHHDGGEAGVVGRRETRRTTRRTRTAGARTAACGRSRSCPPPDSRGSCAFVPVRALGDHLLQHARDRVGGCRARPPGGARAAAGRGARRRRRRSPPPGGAARAMPPFAIVVYTSSICIGGDRDPVADRASSPCSCRCTRRAASKRPDASPGKSEPGRSARSRTRRGSGRSGPCRARCAILIVPTFDECARISATVIVDECDSTSSYSVPPTLIEL